MPDMLVKLYDLPAAEPVIEQLKTAGVEIRRAMAYEKHLASRFARDNFNPGWGSECEVSFGNKPISVFLAVKDKAIIGFACYDSTYRNFFGPLGILENDRNNGIGKALLLSCCHAMKNEGYAYAAIGASIAKEFYGKSVNAFEIPGSDPGIYKERLNEEI